MISGAATNGRMNCLSLPFIHPKPLVGNIHGADHRNVGVIGLLQ
jgi:hypothetical protein